MLWPVSFRSVRQRSIKHNENDEKNRREDCCSAEIGDEGAESEVCVQVMIVQEVEIVSSCAEYPPWSAANSAVRRSQLIRLGRGAVKTSNVLRTRQISLLSGERIKARTQYPTAPRSPVALSRTRAVRVPYRSRRTVRTTGKRMNRLPVPRQATSAVSSNLKVRRKR